MSFNETLAPNDIPEMKYRYHYSLHELIPSNEIEREKKCNSFAFCARICKFIFFESSNFASSVTHTHTRSAGQGHGLFGVVVYRGAGRRAHWDSALTMGCAAVSQSSTSHAPPAPPPMIKACNLLFSPFALYFLYVL